MHKSDFQYFFWIFHINFRQFQFTQESCFQAKKIKNIFAIPKSDLNYLNFSKVKLKDVKKYDFQYKNLVKYAILPNKSEKWTQKWKGLKWS